MLTYIIQVTCCWLVFYLLYIAFLRKETFYHTNRWYLLSTLLVGLVLPLAQYVNFNPVAVAPTVVYLQPVAVGLSYIEVQAEATSHDYWQILLWIYSIGLIVSAGRFGYGLFQIYTLYKQSEKRRVGKLILVQTEKVHLPFSFFNYLFWSKKAELDSTEEEKIWTHEEAHIQEGHTIDVLILEILSVLLWCSPMIYLYKKSLRDVHEYLADARVLESMGVKQYGYLLLRQAQPAGLQMALANHFIQSQLKKRIVMMTKTKSKGWKGFKYLIGIPLMFTLFTVFAFQATDIMDFFEATGKTQASWNIDKLGDNGYNANAVETILLEELNEEQSIFNTDTNEKITDGEFVQSLKLANFHEAYRDIVSLFPAHQAEINEIGYTILNDNNINARIDKGTIIYSSNEEEDDVNQSPMWEDLDPFNPTGSPLVLIEGKEVSLAELEKIDHSQVAEIGITKANDKDAIREYGDKAKDGVIIISLKKESSNVYYDGEEMFKIDPSLSQVYFVNDEEFHGDILKFLPKSFESIMFEEGEEAVKKYGERAKGGAVFFTLYPEDVAAFNQKHSKIKESEPEETFKIVEEMPRFYSEECEAMDSKKERGECSKNKLLEFIYTNIKYPKSARDAAIQGTTVIKFIVEKDGTITEIEAVRKIGGGCDEESVRVINAMPKWIPGKQRGKVVRVQYHMPIKFKLEDKEATPVAKSKDCEKTDPIYLNGERVYRFVDEMPRFKSTQCEEITDTDERLDCANMEVLTFIYKNIKYPKKAIDADIQGTTVASFVVDIDGSIIHPEIMRKIGGGCDEESLRVIQSMPKWIPGMKDGKPAKTQFNLPIKYKLADDEAEEEAIIEPTEAAPVMDLYDIKIFPNPTADIVNIQSKLDAVPTTIWLVDVNGREFYKEELKDFDGILNKRIDISKATKGTLILQIQQGEKVLTHKIIRQ